MRYKCYKVLSESYKYITAGSHICSFMFEDTYEVLSDIKRYFTFESYIYCFTPMIS